MESSSINPYHYNNPVSFKDPTGLAPEPHEKEDELQVEQCYCANPLGWDKSICICYLLEAWYKYYQEISNKYDIDMVGQNKMWASDRAWYAEELGMLSRSGGSNPIGIGRAGGGGASYNNKRQSQGKTQSRNGSYAGSMNLGTPKSWATKDIANTVEPANAKLSEMLQDCNYELEVGYWLINDANNNLTAHFYYGEDSETWVGNLGNITLKISEMLVGFVHVHIANVMTSPYDARSIANIILGRIGFANRPELNDSHFNTMLDKSFFGTIFFNQDSKIQTLEYFGWSKWKNNGSLLDGLSLMLKASYDNLDYRKMFKETNDYEFDYLKLKRSY